MRGNRCCLSKKTAGETDSPNILTKERCDRKMQRERQKVKKVRVCKTTNTKIHKDIYIKRNIKTQTCLHKDKK